MKKELDEKLVKNFPLLYGGNDTLASSVCTFWGFSCGDGWFDIIWELSSKLEQSIQQFIDDNPGLECAVCGCEKHRHYAHKTNQPGKCLSIHQDYESAEEPPGNYYACFCEKYVPDHPRAIQVKEKFGGLRFYMAHGNDEIYNLIEEAESLSYKTCEGCGAPGKARPGSWVKVLCGVCFANI